LDSIFQCQRRATCACCNHCESARVCPLPAATPRVGGSRSLSAGTTPNITQRDSAGHTRSTTCRCRPPSLARRRHVYERAQQRRRERWSATIRIEHQSAPCYLIRNCPETDSMRHPEECDNYLNAHRRNTVLPTGSRAHSRDTSRSLQLSRSPHDGEKPRNQLPHTTCPLHVSLHLPDLHRTWQMFEEFRKHGATRAAGCHWSAP